jgi:hypothetical protein
MAYNVPFNLNPSAPTQPYADLAETGISVSTNPYVSPCGDSASIIKNNYRGMVENYADNYGMAISYWSTGFSISDSNRLYGENPTAKFRGPRKMKAIIDFQSYNTFLTKWGIMSDLDIQIFVPIKAFRQVWGNVLPLAGDLFIIDDSACDRPFEQSPMVFEVTEKDDKIKPADFMGGHYVWKLTAKRMDYSYEPNAPEENFIRMPVDQDLYGKTESTIDETDITQDNSTNHIDETAKEDFFTPNDSVYGKYF